MKGSQFLPFIEHQGLIYTNDSSDVILVCQFPPICLIQESNMFDAIDSIIKKASSRFNDEDFIRESYKLKAPIKVEKLGLIARTFNAKTYNIAFNNCQTFASYMINNTPLKNYR